MLYYEVDTWKVGTLCTKEGCSGLFTFHFALRFRLGWCDGFSVCLSFLERLDDLEIPERLDVLGHSNAASDAPYSVAMSLRVR